MFTAAQRCSSGSVQLRNQLRRLCVVSDYVTSKGNPQLLSTWRELLQPCQLLGAGAAQQQNAALPHPALMTNARGQSLLHVMALSGSSGGMLAMRRALLEEGQQAVWHAALRQQDQVCDERPGLLAQQR